MSVPVPSLAPRPVLADLVAASAARDVATVVAAVLLTAACAQVVMPLPFSPVPLTGQTFAVLLTAAALGPARGTVAQACYVLAGVAGLPFFHQGSSGVAVLTGPTGGYLLGFVGAAAVVGVCARRGWDRRPGGTLAAFALGSAVIYAAGVPWLAAVTGAPAGQALRQGLLPYLVGDAVKALCAAGLLPAAWRAVGRRA